MSKLTRKPNAPVESNAPSRFQGYKLIENPFPPEPAVNKDSDDRRINGAIYEFEIRRKEYEQIETVFLKQQLSSPVHVRLGYIVDTSYIGRGNGKSAFLLNLQQQINNEYCLDISEGSNKCFACYVQPEPGGRTKTFASFNEALFLGILNSKIIDATLTSLRLDAVSTLYPQKEFDLDDDELISKLSTEAWYIQNGIDLTRVNHTIFENHGLQELPSDFPLFQGRNSLLSPLINQTDFERYYREDLKRPRDRIDFLYSHLPRLFKSASFNGGFILVDDFERIPDWQSARQKRDFALELRTALFDGMSVNARMGFYNFILVLHAGVRGLISDAWSESGMESRAPISPAITANHLVSFARLNQEHVVLMVRKYLSEYRLDNTDIGSVSPFTSQALALIGELSEYNAGTVLKICYDLLERAASTHTMIIDESFVNSNRIVLEEIASKGIRRIENTESVNLQEKISNK